MGPYNAILLAFANEERDLARRQAEWYTSVIQPKVDACTTDAEILSIYRSLVNLQDNEYQIINLPLQLGGMIQFLYADVLNRNGYWEMSPDDRAEFVAKLNSSGGV